MKGMLTIIDDNGNGRDFELVEKKEVHPEQQSQQKPQFEVGELAVYAGDLCTVKDRHNINNLVTGVSHYAYLDHITPLAPGVKFRAKDCDGNVKEYVVLKEDRPQIGDYYLQVDTCCTEKGTVAISPMVFATLRWIVLPLALDYWTFEIEGVKCVAYHFSTNHIGVKEITSNRRFLWCPTSEYGFLNSLMNTFAANYECEHGVPLPIIPAEYVKDILKGLDGNYSY